MPLHLMNLKEDGRLNIERINKQPVEEHMRMLGNLTDSHWDYYLSVLPINEGYVCPRNILVDYGFDDKRSGIDIE